MTRPFISFLSDFGTDGPAPICRGVMLGIAPDAQIVDIGHNIRKYAIRDGAFLFWCAVPYLPAGVHVGVVDPGVGTDRRPIAILTARGDRFIGPDNGLFMPATERVGGIVEARVLENRDLWLPVTSSTFHGRDIFSPVGAHLALGEAFDSVGPRIDPATLERLPLPPVHVVPGRLETGVVYVDTFGNVKLSALAADVIAALGPLGAGDRLAIVIGEPPGTRRLEIPWATTFGDRGDGEALVYEDAYARVCIAVNRGSAADALGLTEDLAVAIRRA
jgi:S-adenosylmethionine hydrolase